MTKPKTIYSTGLKVSSILMLLALVWLTVCLPVVYSQQQKQQAALEQQLEIPGDSEGNPLNNTTEEKAGNSLNSLSEEYLHHTHASEHEGIFVKTYYKCHAADLYFAYHPELISPPPNSFRA